MTLSRWYLHITRLSFTSIVAAGLCPVPAASGASHNSDHNRQRDRGITIAQPKLWRYERVYPLLDGMLRDIEAVSLNPLPALDSNQANLAYIDFLRTLLNLQVSYSQTAGFTNQQEVAGAKQQANAQQQEAIYQAQQRQLDQAYLARLKEQRIALQDEVSVAEQNTDAAQNSADAAKPGTPEATAAQNELKRQQDRLSTLQSRQSALNDQISKLETSNSTQSGTGISPSSGPPKLTDVVDVTKAQPSAIPQFLDQVPQDVRDGLLGKSSTAANLPATRQFENYLMLLNERLAKQLSVIADDASRNGYQLYLMEFDVGIYPFSNTKQKIARVEFTVASGDRSELVYPYTLIPGSRVVSRKLWKSAKAISC